MNIRTVGNRGLDWCLANRPSTSHSFPQRKVCENSSFQFDCHRYKVACCR